MNCAICGRVLIDGPSVNEHHLVPKTFKGKETITIHRICHSKIHSIWTERELLQYYHTVERILENEDMKKFILWVSKKPPEFYDSHRDEKNRKRKRRN